MSIVFDAVIGVNLFLVVHRPRRTRGHVRRHKQPLRPCTPTSLHLAHADYDGRNSG
jgi:hypothetical protein